MAHSARGEVDNWALLCVSPNHVAVRSKVSEAEDAISLRPQGRNRRGESYAPVRPDVIASGDSAELGYHPV